MEACPMFPNSSDLPILKAQTPSFRLMLNPTDFWGSISLKMCQAPCP